ncbi:ABC transporter permease [Actinotignum urinale]|uniref:Transport permease protein n=1 Tax=Actinotignum urinale TaxID=190146 RepID=A0AAW9HUX0_9ACTO|nr:ABC transporter permease [Actinotignum urinale]MDY5128600.1 ABC transporter permease [Actinotignum urinale]MDY5132813.1 ABC transporter permease [Actinotignum urinale]MDY5150899.1 ABC transporter permease [Actinotignum urinale]MDY5154137.1 ABC transporter permease [Actinotignum urinale]WIK58548.1 ABC transporter permease [Actinotignum urinale]
MTDNTRTYNALAYERFDRLSHEDLRPVAPTQGRIRGTRASWVAIWEYRNLWWLLVKRELKARYKDSVLGFLWTLIRPLIQLFIYYFAIGKILGAERGIPDFAVYIFAGLTLWQLFSEIVASGTTSIIANAGVIKKVYLPREIFPLAATGASVINFVAQMVILVFGAYFIRGIDIVPFLIYIPASILVALVYGVACALWLSAVNVYLRDVQYLVEVALLVGMWLCPILYSFSMVISMAPAWVATVFSWNPLSLAVMGMQAGVWKAGTLTQAVYPPKLLTHIGIVLAIGIVLIFVAQRYFARKQKNFAQEL